MECDCGNKEATFCKIGFFTNEHGLRERYEYCDKCGDIVVDGVPDVYWDGKPEQNLADGPDGKPITFLSKGQKARYLKERGIYEAGDRFHGAPFTNLAEFDSAKKRRDFAHAASEARRRVENMGRDVRRQAILKVIHEARQLQEA